MWFYPIGAAILFLAWLMPNHYPPWTSFHAELVAFIGLIFVVIKTDKTQLFLPRTTFALFGSVAVIWLQLLFGKLSFSGDAFVCTLYIVGVVLALQAGGSLALKANSDHSLIEFFSAALFAAIVSVLIAIVQWLRMDDLHVFIVNMPPNSRPFANLAQANQFATATLMGAVAVLYLFEQRVVGKAVATLLWMLLMFGLVLSGSRTGLLGATSVCLWWLLKIRRQESRIHTACILLGFSTLALCVYIFPAIAEAMQLASFNVTDATSKNSRFQAWRQLFDGVMQSPWWGYGWLQTAEAQRFGLGATVFTTTEQYAYSHNLFLDLIVWNGVPLGVLASIAMCSIYLLRLKNSVNLSSSYGLAMTIPVVVHSMLEYPYAYSFFIFPVMKLNPYFSRVALSAYALLSILVVREYFLLEEDFRVVRFESMNVGSTDINHQIPKAYFLSHLGSVIAMGRARAAPHMSTESIEQLRKTSYRFAWPPLHMRYVLALSLNDQPALASSELETMHLLYGEKMHAETIKSLQTLKVEKYPQLGTIKLLQ
jgi:hypothetical protein